MREYGGTSVVARFLGTWLLSLRVEDATPDKRHVTFHEPVDPDAVSHAMTIRVPDCQSAYETLLSRGAGFLTPPVSSEWEVRAFFRDPDQPPP